MISFFRNIGNTKQTPAPQSVDELAQQKKQDEEYLQAAWKGLNQTLNESFVINPGREEFWENSTYLLQLIYRYSQHDFSQVNKIAQLLIRRYVFSFYYQQYQCNSKVTDVLSLGSAAEKEDCYQKINNEAVKQTTRIVQEFKRLLAQLMGSGDAAWQQANQIINIDPSNQYISILEEVFESRAIPSLSKVIANIYSQPPEKLAHTPPKPALPNISAPTPQPAAQAQMAQPTLVPQPEPPKPEESDIDRIMGRNTLSQPENLTHVEFSDSRDPDARLHSTGLNLATILNEKLNGTAEKRLISYLDQESSGSRICYGRMVFQLDRKIEPLSINDRMMNHALSLANFEPDTTPYQIKVLKGNKIAIDLPIYVKGDSESSYLIKYLMTETNTESLLRPDRFLELRAAWKQYLRELILLPSGELRFLAGISASGEPLLFKVIGRTGAGMAITGKSGCGKSGQILSFANQIELALTPEEVQFAAMDFKGEAQTLQLIEDSPFLWTPCSQDEWMQTAKAHGLNTSDPDFDRLWNGADLTLPPVAWKADDAIAMMSALEREKSRRAAILAKHKLQNIFEYNDWVKKQNSTHLKPMPLLPILLEEGGGYAREIGSGAACANVHEITSQWRAYGMPLVITVQDGKADTALPPSARLNFATKYLFQSDSLNAIRLLGEDSTAKKWVAIASRLLPQVDAIAYSDNGFSHIHPFFVGTDHVKWVVATSRTIYKTWCDRRQKKIAASAMASISALDELLALPEVEEDMQTELAIAGEKNENRNRYEKLMQFLLYNEEIDAGKHSGEAKITTNQVLVELVGKYRYADTSKFSNGEKTVLNGTNRDRGIKALQELALKYGTRLEGDEIREMRRAAS